MTTNLTCYEIMLSYVSVDITYLPYPTDIEPFPIREFDVVDIRLPFLIHEFTS